MYSIYVRNDKSQRTTQKLDEWVSAYRISTYDPPTQDMRHGRDRRLDHRRSQQVASAGPERLEGRPAQLRAQHGQRSGEARRLERDGGDDDLKRHEGEQEPLRGLPFFAGAGIVHYSWCWRGSAVSDDGHTSSGSTRIRWSKSVVPSFRRGLYLHRAGIPRSTLKLCWP